MKRYSKILAAVLLTLLLTGCGDVGHDPRLERVAAMVSESPRESLAALGGIDTAGLSDSDRAYLALLTVKAGDKAFIPHTTDTVVKSAVEYYSSHPDVGLTPEALYYGGRVYSDLGDYPKALDYFQRALDLLPEGTPDTNLRGNVLSQISDHLIDLGLFEQTIPYIKESVKIDILNKDTVNRALDNCLIGVAYRYMEKYELADLYFRESLVDAEHLPEDIAAEIRVHHAANKYEKGATDSAMRLIRPAVGAVREDCRSMMLAYAAKIYLEANVLDTAYRYASTLAMDTTLDNRKTGYMVMLSPKLRDYISEDSLDYYYADYKHVLEKHFFNRDKQGTLLQNSMYNYKVHERERMKAERNNDILKRSVAGFAFLALALCIIVLFLKNRNKRNIIKLHNALENIERLKQSLNQRMGRNPAGEEEAPGVKIEVTPEPVGQDEAVDRLRERLRDKLKSLYDENKDKIEISPIILRSAAYAKLKELIAGNSELKEKDKLWGELEEIVLKSSPNFKENLKLLVGGKFSSYDLHTSLLIKCGVTPTQMSKLFNRTKGTIVSRRESICQRVFDKNLGVQIIDGVIRLL